MKIISGKFFRASRVAVKPRDASNTNSSGTILDVHRTGWRLSPWDGTNKTLRLLLLPFLLVAAAAWAQSPVYTIGVDGLSCPFCAYGIEKQLTKLDGVKQVKVDVAKGQVVVSMNEGKTLEQAQAAEAVKKAGFTLRSFEPGQEDTGS